MLSRRFLLVLVSLAALVAACATPDRGGGGASSEQLAPAPAAAPASGTGPEVRARRPGGAQTVASPCSPSADAAANRDAGRPQVEAGIAGDVDAKTGAVTGARPYGGHRCP